MMRSKSQSQLEYKYLPIVTDKQRQGERGRGGGGANFEEVSPFFQMTLTAKVLAEHKVSPRGRNECFFEPKFTGATCKYAGFSMHACQGGGDCGGVVGGGKLLTVVVELGAGI